MVQPWEDGAEEVGLAGSRGTAERKMWRQDGPNTLWEQIRGKPRLSVESPGAIAYPSAELTWGNTHSLLIRALPVSQK